MHWLILFLFLFPKVVLGQSFDSASTVRVQQSLERMGYPIGVVDGRWGERTSSAVQEYRFNFGFDNRSTLTPTEARELTSRANILTRPSGMITAKNFSHGNDEVAYARQSANYEPAELLFASPRHALALEMLNSRPAKFDTSISYALRTQWLTSGRQRSKRWLHESLVSVPKRQDGTNLLPRTLLELDLALTSFGLPITRNDIIFYVFPNLELLNKSFPAGRLQGGLDRRLSERLFRDLGNAMSALNCRPGWKIDRRWSNLALEIMRRFETFEPNSPHLLGYGKRIAECSDEAIRVAMLEWRIERANRIGDHDFVYEATEDAATIFFQNGADDAARALYESLFRNLPQARKNDIIRDNTSALIALGLKDIVSPYLFRGVETLRGKTIQSTAAMGSARYTATNLLRLGYGFDVVDRIFFETDNFWKTKGDVYGFYAVMIASLINDDNGEDALEPLGKLILRAQSGRNLKAAEGFREQEISILFDLGRYSEAEEKINDFIRFSQEGARDQRVSAWHTQLNLSRDEGRSPGRVFARQFAKYLDAVCVTNATDDAYRLKPSLEREAVYADPIFLSTAYELGISRKIAECRGADWLDGKLSRLGCYLWTKEGNMTDLHRGVQRWWKQQTLRTGQKGVEIDGFGGMGCLMGVAEAGGNEIIAQYAAQISAEDRRIGFQLLRLSAGLPIGKATISILDAGPSITRSRYEADFSLLEVAGRMNHRTRFALRSGIFRSFESHWSGAAMDNAEWASIRANAFDEASGYAAMNLNEVALMFIEGASLNMGESLDETQALNVLGDVDRSRFALARGRVALKQGDAVTAKQLSAPIISAYVNQVRSGQAGSIEELASWAGRLRGFVELYFSALVVDPSLLASERPENVLDAQQLLAAAHASTSSGRLAARLTSADPDLARAYQDSLMDFRGALRVASQDGDRTRVVALGDKMAELRLQLARRDPAFGANADLSVASVSEIRARAPGNIIVIASQLPEHLLFTKVDAETVTLHVLPLPEEKLASAIQSFRQRIQEEEDVADESGTLLSATFLSLFGQRELPGRLTFVVEGPLVSLPFAALPLTINGQRSYLGAETALSIAPSLTMLKVGGRKSKGAEKRPFLGIGDAKISPETAHETFGFIPQDLRETNTELRFMAGLLGADLTRDLLVGPAATEQRITQMSQSGELARYRILTIATHGFMGQQGRLTEPGLLLSEPQSAEQGNDGFLAAREIYDLKLDSDLVILSACNTGAVEGAARGLSDLAQAFTFAGARGLVVTHWEIDTYAAVEISRRLATEMQSVSDVPFSEIFKRVVKSLLDSPESSRFHHPKFWASHAVVGF